MFKNNFLFLRIIPGINKEITRFRNPPHHWSVLRKKVHPVDKALQFFDDFYKLTYQEKWASIRKGLLCKPKYVAILNNFGDDKQTIIELQLKGALNVQRLFSLEKGYIVEKGDYKPTFSANQIENTEGDQTFEATPAKKHLSLNSMMSDAKFDRSRLIDPKNSLSSEIFSEFIPATEIKGKEDFIPEYKHQSLHDVTQYADFEREYDLEFPEHLKIFCFEKGNKRDFEPAKKSSTGVLNYYLMDGGSVLPILALDIKPGHRILDMCAAPGGKSLLMLQTLCPIGVVSNDVSKSRCNRLQGVYNQFLYDFKERWVDTGKVTISHSDARNIVDDNFDRILVDVPCTTDRHSLLENDNNIFNPRRIKERLQLPELQKSILVHALKIVKKGGIVVYSTCSLNPIQNDGVVHMALKEVWEETNMKFLVKDLTPALTQTRSVYELADRKLLVYGQLVLPSQLQNFGPTYFCKLQKIK